MADIAAAQSFDRVAQDYDRLGELNENTRIISWLQGLLPAAGTRALDLGCGTGRHAVLLAGRFGQVDAVDLSGPMIDVARRRRPRPNITYRQADLRDVDEPGEYDFVLSMLTLHHLPDLHAALSHIKSLLAPGGRLAVLDPFPRSSRPGAWPRLEQLVPLRLRLQGQAVLRLGLNQLRRGPATAWEIYRLQIRPDWLDHRVTDRFFSREELERTSQVLFPGGRLDEVGGTVTGLVWDAPR